MAERDAAAAVDAAHVAAGDADDGGFHRHAGDAFGFFERRGGWSSRRRPD